MGHLEPNEHKCFVLKLFGTKCGVNNLRGLVLSDLESKKDVCFQIFCSINVIYE